MRKLGMDPDPWQIDVLHGEPPRVLLNCCRQAGKSTTVAVLALVREFYQLLGLRIVPTESASVGGNWAAARFAVEIIGEAAATLLRW